MHGGADRQRPDQMPGGQAQQPADQQAQQRAAQPPEEQRPAGDIAGHRGDGAGRDRRMVEPDQEGQDEDDEEDARAMDQADGALVGAALRPHHHHLGNAAGHAGEIGGGRVELRDLAEIGDAQQRGGGEEEGQGGERDDPVARLWQQMRAKAATQHHADHRRHRAAGGGGSLNRQTGDAGDRAGRHRSEHPGQWRMDRPEKRAAGRPDGKRRQEAEECVQSPRRQRGRPGRSCRPKS